MTDTSPSTRRDEPDAAGPVVVGIGASAGGLAALKTLFGRVPEDSGVAFVVVVHLSPEHESHLAELLQPHVKLPVNQVTETVVLEPDCVYVIPPGRNLTAVDTHLRLSELPEQRSERAPIDHFFRTLAHTQGKRSDDTVRVWSVGCATGEEAYSLAILLLEEVGRRESPPRVQVFASDLHEHSLKRARDGLYPGDIAADVSPQRLSRYFDRQEGGYRIRKSVRELVVFAPHDLLADPPFSHIALVVCRNVLIYLQREVQRDVVERFLPPSLLVGPEDRVLHLSERVGQYLVHPGGYEVARRIRSEDWGRDMLLIAQTGWGRDEDREQTRAAGFDHHLTKPVPLRRLKQLLERRSPTPEDARS